MKTNIDVVGCGRAQSAGFATSIEAARFLRLSKAMVHKLIGEGKMPACRYGRAVRIPWVWLRRQAGVDVIDPQIG